MSLAVMAGDTRKLDQLYKTMIEVFLMILLRMIFRETTITWQQFNNEILERRHLGQPDPQLVLKNLPLHKAITWILSKYILKFNDI